MPLTMKLSNPSLAARAVAQLIDCWPTYSHGEFVSGNLSLAGFNVLDHGNFASVIEGKPGQVIKVFSLTDIGYQFLLNYAVECKGDHLPKILSFSKSGRYGIVEMERLEHQVKSAVAIASYLDRVRTSKRMPNANWGITFQDSILDLNAAVKLYNKTSNVKLTWDCHENNIMFRGTTPVLCDVIFGELT